METGKEWIREIQWLSSMEKVFPQGFGEGGLIFQTPSVLCNEMYSFQLAFLCGGSRKQKIKVEKTGGLAPYVKAREVCLMPSRYPGENNLGTKESALPGMYPDRLRTIQDDGMWIYPGQWQSIFLTVDFSGEEFSEIPLGMQGLLLKLEPENGGTDGDDGEQGAIQAEITLNIRKEKLARQSLYHTEWFHADCLADYYGMEPWSPEYWGILENYLRHYAKMGMNMILVPTFTPPLDTAVGGERTTVQLVEAEASTMPEGTAASYRFSFDRLHRFLTLCQSAGIRYFEMAHLFTQWGAKAAPKIMAAVADRGGEIRRIFGWETKAQSAEYRSFLEQYLKALVEQLDKWGLRGRIFFHLSDEPEEENREAYAAAKEQVLRLLGGYPVLDAVSRYSFYEQGIVEYPVPAIDHMEPFMASGISHMWTYYCCAQDRDVTNRFFSMPLARTRALGVLLYYFHIEGFLHWGYNFYNSQYSLEHLNPYADTDAGGAFPSGDSFLVYPGKDGFPEDSLRMMAITEAMQDVRALEALESLCSREEVLRLIESLANGALTLRRYPVESSFYQELREKVNLALFALSKDQGQQ